MTLLQKILNEPKPLSPSQRDAVLSTKNHVRIIAGAGAGKTETLTRKIVYLLLCENVAPSSIVAFTFTEKAAQSMKSRVYDRIKQLGEEKICSRLGELFIGTIHGYCNQILEDHFGYGDYGALDENQEMAFIVRFGWDIGLGKGSYSSNCERFLETLSVVYGELIPKSLIKKHAPDFLKSMEEYENLLDSHRRLTFNRMISLAIENLNENPDVLEHVKYLIVDEYQDINRAQEKLIQLIGNDSKIFIVGDPRQTIYQWRGSDEGCFEDFVKHYSDTETIPIIENRRSAKSIIGLSNQFSNNFDKKYAHLTPTRTEEGEVFLGEFENNVREAEWIADQIKAHVKDKSCVYSDIGILCRSVNTSGPVFIDIFRERGIPLMVGGKVGLFRRPEIKAIGKLFVWLYDNGFWKDNRWSKECIEGDDLLTSAVEDWKIGVPDVSLQPDINEKLAKWKEKVLTDQFHDFTQLYYELLTILEYLELNPDNPNHAVIMANLGRFSTLLTDYESANKYGGRKKNWNRDIKGLFWYMHSHATKSYEEQPGDEIQGINAVQMMTVHQAKGLEWPVVFIPAMVEKRFPSMMTGRLRNWDIPRTLFNSEKYEGDIDGERKLFYVALTRAKDMLIVSHFNQLNSNVGVSSFINHELDQSKMKKIIEKDKLPICKVPHAYDIEDIQTFAAGEILTYGKCPYLYRFNQVWGYQPGLKEMIGYGNALHYCLRHASELIRDEGYSPVSAVATSVEENFYLPFAGPKVSENAKKNAKQKLVAFVQKHVDDMMRIKEVESRIEFPIHRATIMGKVDVILHGNDNIEIRDYKTSDSVISKEEAAMQVQLYTAGLKMIGEPVAKGSISYLENAITESVNVDDSTLKTTTNAAENYIERIMNRDFTPCPGEFCGTCNYVDICRYKK